MTAPIEEVQRPYRRFGPGYREEVALRGGRRVRLGLLRPEHAPLLLQAFERLSARSRHLRFFAGKKKLSDVEVRYLTEVDGERHFALGAAVRTARGWEGVGVARFVELPAHPHGAELALTILDELQGLGLGSVLLDRLVAAALERGYTQLNAEVLWENRRMLRLLRRASPATVVRARAGVLEVEVPLRRHRESGWFPAYTPGEESLGASSA